MSWTREFHLFLNVDLEPGKVLLRDKTGQAAAPRPDWVSADVFPVNLWLRKPSSVNGQSATGVVVDPTDQIILSGKATAAGALLFSAIDWVLTGTEEADDQRYVAVLDLNTDALSAAFGSALQLLIVGEIEIQNEANTRRISAQFPINIRKQIYAGEGTPTPAAPAYPLPGALVTKNPTDGTYRVKTDETGSYWQVKNATTGKWHTLWLVGEDEASTLTWSPVGEV